MPNPVEIVEPNTEVDTLDFLNTSLDNEDNQEDKSIALKTDEEESKDEEKLELSDDASEVKEDELAFVTPFKKSEVLKAYPDIFKKFPDMQSKIYKSEKYEEVFPTVKDANEAKERVEVLERAEAALFSGEITDILKSVKSEDEEAFKRIVDNFLPTIQNLDRAAYVHVIGNIGKFFIESIAGEAGRFAKDSDQQRALLIAASTLNQYLFGTTNYTPPTKLAKEITDNDKRIKEREKELTLQRFQEVQSDLIERTTNTITATINKYIDPKETMSMYVRTKAIQDCKNLLDKTIASDEIFKSKLDRLWQNVIESGFTKAAQEQVKTTYLGKVQSILLDIIKKVRNEALSGMTSSRVKKEEEQEEKPIRRTSSVSSTVKRGNDDGPRRGESTKAYLDRTLGQ